MHSKIAVTARQHCPYILCIVNLDYEGVPVSHLELIFFIVHMF